MARTVSMLARAAREASAGARAARSAAAAASRAARSAAAAGSRAARSGSGDASSKPRDDAPCCSLCNLRFPSDSGGPLPEQMREFRKNQAPPVAEDASGFEKFKAMVYSTVVKVPVAAVELYLDVRSTIEHYVWRVFTSDKLLPDLLPQEQHVFTLVLDLNETLCYTEWQHGRGWVPFKRPGLDDFLKHMAKIYEVVVYSDQPPMYVDPVIYRLDSKGYIRYRLSRTATKYQDGKLFRDLSKLNRNPARVIYISAHSESCFQPEKCIQIKPWKLEDGDTQLQDLIPFLECVVFASDIRVVLATYQGRDVATGFLERLREYQRLMQEQD
ncbi:mitochondrial import inner membrane translocase subunit TIM50-like isoform X2 [Phragmites australis]|uniref:mitochondrial import inner membrane translocase subunit TIM50-like isoform X2 n=1 Tax=Phragmites australis TaxID=29695 RepID=UPI002D767DFB|nr:mitochondrial import inner membrane translocase subunit TIM50-like isoform X2 [Phragmites australis]